MIALFMAIGLAAGGGAKVVPIADATIRIGDVLPGAGARAIARLPDARRSVTLTRAALASLIRRAAPETAIGSLPPSMTFRRSFAPVQPTCFVARVPIPAGEAIIREQVQSGICAATTPHVRHLGTAIVATHPIATGEPVGGAISSVPTDIVRGAALTLVSRSGPVTIERPVTALQPGRAGGRAFVRDADGQVFAVAVAR